MHHARGSLIDTFGKKIEILGTPRGLPSLCTTLGDSDIFIFGLHRGSKVRGGVFVASLVFLPGHRKPQKQALSTISGLMVHRVTETTRRAAT
jgi:hypothetical protein